MLPIQPSESVMTGSKFPTWGISGGTNTISPQLKGCDISPIRRVPAPYNTNESSQLEWECHPTCFSGETRT